MPMGYSAIKDWSTYIRSYCDDEDGKHLSFNLAALEPRRVARSAFWLTAGAHLTDDGPIPILPPPCPVYQQHPASWGLSARKAPAFIASHQHRSKQNKANSNTNLDVRRFHPASMSTTVVEPLSVYKRKRVGITLSEESRAIVYHADQRSGREAKPNSYFTDKGVHLESEVDEISLFYEAIHGQMNKVKGRNSELLSKVARVFRCRETPGLQRLRQRNRELLNELEGASQLLQSEEHRRLLYGHWDSKLIDMRRFSRDMKEVEEEERRTGVGPEEDVIEEEGGPRSGTYSK